MIYFIIYYIISRIIFLIAANTLIKSFSYHGIFVFAGLLPLYGDIIIFPVLLIGILEENFGIYLFNK